MEMIHYTSRRNWARIKDKGILEPRTPFVKDHQEEKMIESAPEIRSLLGRRYIVTIPADRRDDWKKYGLLQKLTEFTSGQAALNFSLGDVEGVIVRDHYFTTIEYSIIRYGRNVLDERPASLNARRGMYNESALGLWQEYLLSTKSLDTADLSSIKVPEVWIPFPIPVQMIKAEVEPIFSW